MPYPEEAEGFQVDGPASFTQFHKRFVSIFLGGLIENVLT
jgi:alcohol dehydrogenase (NADP+)